MSVVYCFSVFAFLNKKIKKLFGKVLRNNFEEDIKLFTSMTTAS